MLEQSIGIWYTLKYANFKGGLIMPALEAKKNIYWVGVLDK